MKELSIEQKAEAYDKAIEGIQEILSSGQDSIKMSRLQLRLQGIFPELKESEDERVRKKIIEYMKTGTYNKDYIRYADRYSYEIWRKLMDNFKNIKDYHIGCNEVSDIVLNAIIDTFNWLEKGGDKNKVSKHVEAINEEKVDDANKVEPKDYNSIDPHFFKTTDKVEPKFKVGDWISGYYTNYKVLSLNNDGYVVEDVDGDKINILFENEKFHHLFTIADAKDGDVLCYENEISIYKHDIKNCTKQKTTFGGFVYHCCYDGKRFITDSLYSLTEKDKKNIYPATKEQRDTLEKAMTDAGYIFDFESKELKKLGQSEVTKMSDQEEIAEIPFGAKDSELQEATYYIPKGFHAEIDDDKVVIKRGKQKPAWSEEDALRLEEVICMIEANGRWVRSGDAVKLNSDWLKSLKQRIGG